MAQSRGGKQLFNLRFNTGPKANKYVLRIHRFIPKIRRTLLTTKGPRV